MSISTWFYTNFKQYDFAKFQNCGAWTKLGAVDRFLGNDELHKILYMQPELFTWFRYAIVSNTNANYNRFDAMTVLLKEISDLVGWYSNVKELGSSKVYDLVRGSLLDLLAPDYNDLLMQAKEEDELEADGPTDFGLTWDAAFERAISSGSPIFQEQLRGSDVVAKEVDLGVYELHFLGLRED